MLGRVIFQKYLDPGSPVVDVHIDGIIVPHTSIDLGATINVINTVTIFKLNLQGCLRKTTIMLQLVNRSIVAHAGVVKDVMGSIDSWSILMNS